MHFKKTKAGLLALIMLTSFSAGAAASGTIQNITAQLNGSIKFKLNGNNYIPTNTDGTKLDPISYNGRTYLPLRSIADAFKVAVDWDANNNTVILGEREGKGVSMLDFNPSLGGYCANFTKIVDKERLTFPGEESVTFSNGFYIEGTNKYDAANNSRSVFKLDGKYQKLSFNTWSIGKDAKITIRDFEKNVDLKVLSSLTSSLTSNFEVEVGGVKQLEIKVEVAELSKAVIAEPYLK